MTSNLINHGKEFRFFSPGGDAKILEGFSRERTRFDELYGIMEGNMETHKKDVAIIQVKG